MAALVALAVLGAAGPAAAQRGYDQRSNQDPYTIDNIPYDGRFTFARIRFEPAGGGGGGFRSFRNDLKWDHDFPRAERNFMKILSEVSDVRPYMDGGNVFTLDDPELFKFPIAYMSEPGFWEPTPAESAALRSYLAKGGFIIFDDFFGGHWFNFEKQIRALLPASRLVQIDPKDPIFDSFFRVETGGMGGQGRRGAPEFWGIYEDNDPAKRLIMIANFNNDLGENWEWSDAGYIPVDESNEAYKLGINYLMYAMTH